MHLLTKLTQSELVQVHLLRFRGASVSCGAQRGLLVVMVAGADRLEIKFFIPTALSSGERKGEDTGSREEMGAFLTTEEGEPE